MAQEEIMPKTLIFLYIAQLKGKGESLASAAPSQIFSHIRQDNQA